MERASSFIIVRNIPQEDPSIVGDIPPSPVPYENQPPPELFGNLNDLTVTPEQLQNVDIPMPQGIIDWLNSFGENPGDFHIEYDPVGQMLAEPENPDTPTDTLPNPFELEAGDYWYVFIRNNGGYQLVPYNEQEWLEGYVTIDRERYRIIMTDRLIIPRETIIDGRPREVTDGEKSSFIKAINGGLIDGEAMRAVFGDYVRFRKFMADVFDMIRGRAGTNINIRLLPEYEPNNVPGSQPREGETLNPILNGWTNPNSILWKTLGFWRLQYLILEDLELNLGPSAMARATGRPSDRGGPCARRYGQLRKPPKKKI
tara:strand:- start:42 stop:983 length:942 start_codon:yes stop_codon:yes gene_type:complete